MNDMRAQQQLASLQGPNTNSCGLSIKGRLLATVQCCRELTCFPDVFFICCSVSVSFLTVVATLTAWLPRAWRIA